MKTCLLTFAAIAAVAAGTGAASAQAANNYSPPRTTWGAPVLDGDAELRRWFRQFGDWLDAEHDITIDGSIDPQLALEAWSEQDPLTDREREILILVAQGNSNKRIAQQLDVSVRTVETHRLNLRKKLGIETPAGLIRYALQQGWIKV